jgi:hypothetical protein
VNGASRAAAGERVLRAMGSSCKTCIFLYTVAIDESVDVAVAVFGMRGEDREVRACLGICIRPHRSSTSYTGIQ